MKINYLYIYIVVLYFLTILENIILENFYITYGKDDGLFLRIFTICIFGSIYLYFLYKYKIKYLFLGFIIGLISYIIMFYIVVDGINFLVYYKKNIYLEQAYEQLISLTLLIIIGLIFRKIFPPDRSDM